MDRVVQIAHEVEPLDAYPRQMPFEFVQIALTKDAVGENRYVEAAIEQVENEIKAFGMKGGFAPEQGYVALAGGQEEIGDVDKIFPGYQVGRAGHFVSGETIRAGAVAKSGQEYIGHSVVSSK